MAIGRFPPTLSRVLQMAPFSICDNGLPSRATNEACQIDQIQTIWRGNSGHFDRGEDLRAETYRGYGPECQRHSRYDARVTRQIQHSHERIKKNQGGKMSWSKSASSLARYDAESVQKRRRSVRCCRPLKRRCTAVSSYCAWLVSVSLTRWTQP